MYNYTVPPGVFYAENNVWTPCILLKHCCHNYIWKQEVNVSRYVSNWFALAWGSNLLCIGRQLWLIVLQHSIQFTSYTFVTETWYVTTHSSQKLYIIHVQFLIPGAWKEVYLEVTALNGRLITSSTVVNMVSSEGPQPLILTPKKKDMNLSMHRMCIYVQ